MTNPGTPSAGNAELARQRKSVATARRELRRQSIEMQEAGDALDALKRSAGSRNKKQLTAAEERVRTAAAARAAAVRAVKAEVALLGPMIAVALPRDPSAEVAQLAADRPIVLLPIRLETRFVGDELLLRVYPDDVFADTHEPELTDLEVTDGETFWKTGWTDEAAEKIAWKTLVDAVGAPRAGWVARQTEPTNLAQRPGTPLVFPAVARRESAWTQAAEAHLLPDRWIVTLYRRGGGERVATSAPVREPLTLTMSPDGGEPRSALSDDGLEIDDALRWTVDFDVAVDVGMAVRIPLTADERANGFERVIAVGVKSSLLPDQVPAALSGMFDNHRYGRGVSIVAQGTPTNNTAAAPAPFPPPDPDGSQSFAADRRAISPVDGRDGGRLMRAFGLSPAAVEHWPGADGRSDQAASAMARALWPTTLRYFLEQMMDPVFGRSAIALAQDFFVNHVRGRGPLPAFRIGNTPYTVLPVSSLERWNSGERRNDLDRELPGALRRLLPFWSGQMGNVPRVGRSDDPDADLLGILGMDASTREVRLRSVLGEDVQWNTFGFFGWLEEWLGWWDWGQQLAKRVFERLGHPEWHPRIASVNFGDQAWPYQYNLVSEDPAAERDTLSPNYIDWIGAAAAPDLTSEGFPSDWTRTPRSLLYKLLRHAALLEYHDASFELLVRFDQATELDRREHELVGLPDQGSNANRAGRLSQTIPPLTGNQPLHIFLANRSNAATLRAMLPHQELVGFREALSILAPLSSAELERLLTETLDVVSHRIDAWITGLASKRLAEMRAAQPLGSHLGAYGWVENLTPRAPALGEAMRLPDGRLATRQSGNGGFVQAPSLTHATAAAVLRNAYLSRTGDTREQYTIDLSSARVRLARFVLDAVREGQQLGAVLGYQIERGLHDRLQDIAIDALRRIFPLVAGKSNDPIDATEPQEQIAARNVVDGLGVRTAYREKRLKPELLGLDAGSPAWDAVQAEVVLLDNTVDALADLLLAESTYQIVKGSPDVAAATLDSMAQGTVRPPDPEIATVPRRGTPLTHRVAIVLGSDPPVLPAGWRAVETPRAELEPWVDAWLGDLFGDPTQINCHVEFGPQDAPTGETTVSLDLLDLRPIDVLAIARASGSEERGATRAGASELDRRVRDAAYASEGITEEEEVRIAYGFRPVGFDATTDKTFADVLEIARSIEQVLRVSRPLTPNDLVAEDRSQEAEAADLLPEDAMARAEQACVKLNTALDALETAVTAAAGAPAGQPFNLTALRAALRGASLAGVASAYPINSLGSNIELRPPLVSQARSVLIDGRERLAQARALLTEAGKPSHAGESKFQLSAATEAAGLACGTATPFLPRFSLRPPGSVIPSAVETELGNAVAYWTNAGFVSAEDAERERELSRFEIVAARVRPALDAWRRLELTTGLLGKERAPRIVAQLPYDATARWAALPFADEEHRPRPGRVSILLHRVGEAATSLSWAGYLLDQWVEQIAQSREQTGIAFHYDDPGAEAPQTILLAVPPSRAPNWDLPSLLAILNETLDLAKVRAVDGELLGELGQVLPGIYLSDSTREVTVRTSFLGALQTETMIVGLAAAEE